MDKFTFIKKASEICGFEEGECGYKKIIDKHDGEFHTVAYSIDDEILYFRGNNVYPNMIFCDSYKKTNTSFYDINKNSFIKKTDVNKEDSSGFSASNMRTIVREREIQKDPVERFWREKFKNHIEEKITIAANDGLSEVVIDYFDILKFYNDFDTTIGKRKDALMDKTFNYLKDKGFYVSIKDEFDRNRIFNNTYIFVSWKEEE